jgi:hypothetical protein
MVVVTDCQDATVTVIVTAVRTCLAPAMAAIRILDVGLLGSAVWKQGMI